MNKFSLYDFMGILLPGFVLTWMLNALFVLFNLKSYTPLDTSLSGNFGLTFCISLVLGSFLYAFNFWLIKQKWYTRITSIYKSVDMLYYQFNFNKSIQSTINQRLKNSDKNILPVTHSDYIQLSSRQKKKLYELHDTFYDNMYYELEYLGKLEQPKTFQSFYFFFRQLFSACWVTLIIFILLIAISFIPCSIVNKINPPTLLVNIFLFITSLLVCLYLARWYRKRMVLKMYWCFYTHINQTKK